MDKFYKVVERSLYHKWGNTETIFLVKGNKQSLEKLCEKMADRKDFDFRNFYDLVKIDVEKAGENANLEGAKIYEYEVFKRENFINNDDSEIKGYILSNDKQMQEMKTLFEQSRQGLKENESFEVVYKPAEILTCKQAYEKFNNMMKDFNSTYRIYEDDNVLSK